MANHNSSIVEAIVLFLQATQSGSSMKSLYAADIFWCATPYNSSIVELDGGGIQSSLAVGISTTGDGTIAFEYGVQQDRKFKKERSCGVFARVHYRVAQKRKGEFSCEISPSQFRFFRDPVLVPNHNACIPESFGTHERSPCFYLTLL